MNALMLCWKCSAIIATKFLPIVADGLIVFVLHGALHRSREGAILLLLGL